jgi:hypothetical protein
MKKTILKVAVTCIMVTVSLTTFAQQNKKAAKERKDIAKAEKNLGEAKADSAADFNAFKKDAETKIAENQNKIAELKLKKTSDNMEVKEKYDKKVLTLEKKNNDLKLKIDQCADTKTSKWSAFKREFTHDIDELGHAIRDIGVDNTN